MDETNWIDVIAAAELPRDDVLGLAVAGREVALYTVGDAVYATDNQCSHGDGRLCEGFLEGHQIECPLHQGRFDVRNGQPTWDPACVPLRSYPVRVQHGRVWLSLE